MMLKYLWPFRPKAICVGMAKCTLLVYLYIVIVCIPGWLTPRIHIQNEMKANDVENV